MLDEKSGNVVIGYHYNYPPVASGPGIGYSSTKTLYPTPFPFFTKLKPHVTTQVSSPSTGSQATGTGLINLNPHLLLAILVHRTTSQTTLNMSDQTTLNMSDVHTAAFFAKKNKKKKFNKFNGFNANRIDVSQVSSSIM